MKISTLKFISIYSNFLHFSLNKVDANSKEVSQITSILYEPQCPYNFRPIAGRCVENQCYCDPSTGVAGTCFINDAPNCQSCFDGYILKGGVCEVRDTLYEYGNSFVELDVSQIPTLPDEIPNYDNHNLMTQLEVTTMPNSIPVLDMLEGDLEIGKLIQNLPDKSQTLDITIDLVQPSAPNQSESKPPLSKRKSRRRRKNRNKRRHRKRRRKPNNSKSDTRLVANSNSIRKCRNRKSYCEKFARSHNLFDKITSEELHDDFCQNLVMRCIRTDTNSDFRYDCRNG